MHSRSEEEIKRLNEVMALVHSVFETYQLDNYSILDIAEKCAGYALSFSAIKDENEDAMFDDFKERIIGYRDQYIMAFNKSQRN